MISCIYGTDAYRIEHKLKELATEFGRKRDKQGLNIIRLDGTTIETEHLRQEALTVPFLGEKKMIIITGITANRKQHQKVLDFLKSAKNIDNVLVFVEYFSDPKKIPTSAIFKYLTSLEYTWKYEQLSAAETEKWLTHYTQGKNINISPAGIRALILLVGNNLQQITTELNKLTAYRNGETIEVDDINLIVSGSTDSHIFQVIDAISAQNQTLSLQLITHYLNEGNHPLTLTTMLSRQFILLLQIKTFDGNPNDIARELRVHPFVAQKARASAQKFSTSQLEQLCDEILEIEQLLKRSYPNPPLLFAKLIDNLAIKNTPRM